MNSLPHAVLHEEFSLLVWRPQGVIDETEVNQLTAQLGNVESHRFIPFNRFTDTQNADSSDLNLLYTFHVSLYHRSSSHGLLIKSAILTTSQTKGRYRKLRTFLTQGSPIDVRIFDKREEAAAWLGVPVAALASDDRSAPGRPSMRRSPVTIHQAA